MNAKQILTVLKAQGIEVTAAGDNLKIDAPKGAITPSLQTELRIHKLEILDMLKPPTLPGLVAPLPVRWVYPEIAAGFADLPAEGWPLKLYRETTAEWIEFPGPGELQAAMLEDDRLPLPANNGWRGGQ